MLSENYSCVQSYRDATLFGLHTFLQQNLKADPHCCLRGKWVVECHRYLIVRLGNQDGKKYFSKHKKHVVWLLLRSFYHLLLLQDFAPNFEKNRILRGMSESYVYCWILRRRSVKLMRTIVQQVEIPWGIFPPTTSKKQKFYEVIFHHFFAFQSPRWGPPIIPNITLDPTPNVRKYSVRLTLLGVQSKWQKKCRWKSIYYFLPVSITLLEPTVIIPNYNFESYAEGSKYFVYCSISLRNYNPYFHDSHRFHSLQLLFQHCHKILTLRRIWNMVSNDSTFYLSLWLHYPHS